MVLVTSNLSFPHNVFQSYISLVRQNAVFCGNELLKELTICQTIQSQGPEPFPKRQNLDSSKPKEIEDNNFKFDGNGRRVSKRVENTVGKGKIHCYEQFLLFPKSFQ